MQRLIVLSMCFCVSGIAQQPVFRSTADAVVVDVSVRRQGRPVPNLTASDFQITDNGVDQTVVDISVEGIPVDLALLVDRSASLDRPTVNRIRAAASAIPAILSEGDRHELIWFASVARIAQSIEELDLEEPSGLRLTALFDSLASVVMKPVDPGWRRVVIVLTDGIDTASMLDYSLRATILDRTSAVVHLMSIVDSRLAGALSGPSERVFEKPSRLGDERYAWVLRDAVDRTGGRFYDVLPGQDLVPTLRAAIEEFRTRYVLRYTPSGVNRAGWHDLKVTVRGRDYDVRHRRGYWRGTTTS
jgi:Ca-activated chloride channel family protein